MQETNPGSYAPEQEIQEVATQVGALSSKPLPTNAWRSPAEVQQAREFARRTGLSYEAVVADILEAAEPQTGARILDVATGTGFIARQLAIRVSATGRIVGVDASPELIEQARLGAQSAGLTLRAEWRVAAADQLPFPDENFDAVTCATVFHQLPTTQFLNEAYRVLRIGGRLVVADELKSPATPLGVWSTALRSYDRFFRREQIETNEQFYFPEQIVEMITEVGFSQLLVKGLQPHNRRGRVFSLIKAIK